MVGPDHGWRILYIVEGGPCDELDLVVYFDFLVGVNGHRLDMDDPTSLFRTVQDFENQDLLLTFYNYKTDKTRTHKIIPKTGNSALGLMICNDSFNNQDESIVKVKKIEPASPGDLAGLQIGEIILCTKERVIKSIEIFRIILGKERGQSIDFWAYNSERCDIRMVTIDIPPGGRIGCQVSEGIMHSIPKPTKPISWSSLSESSVNENSTDNCNSLQQLEDAPIPHYEAGSSEIQHSTATDDVHYARTPMSHGEKHEIHLAQNA